MCLWWIGIAWLIYWYLCPNSFFVDYLFSSRLICWCMCPTSFLLDYLFSSWSGWVGLAVWVLVSISYYCAVVRPILIFRTKRYWILFRIGPERRRKAECVLNIFFVFCFIMQSGDPGIIHELSNQILVSNSMFNHQVLFVRMFIQHRGSPRSFCLVKGELSWLHSYFLFYITHKMCTEHYLGSNGCCLIPIVSRQTDQNCLPCT
jgi:hypothetical protein